MIIALIISGLSIRSLKYDIIEDMASRVLSGSYRCDPDGRRAWFWIGGVGRRSGCAVEYCGDGSVKALVVGKASSVGDNEVIFGCEK